MIRVDVRFFAMQRAQTGRRRYELQLTDGADVAMAWTTLVTELPVLESATASVRFARNGSYVGPEEPLADGDELAVIPPVAGGSGSSQGRGFRRIEISESPLDGELLAQLRTEVASDEDGAVAVFIGQTRVTPGTPAPGQEAEAQRFAGQDVEGLSYEAFEPMAVSVLGQIADEMEERFGATRVAIVHRVGDVGVGEASVVIVVATPHRDEAFSACRYAIEELKARAPIWKAERFTDGSVWMGAPARSGPDETEPH